MIEIVSQMFYLALGVAVGMALSFAQAAVKGGDPFLQYPAACVGGFGSNLSWAFSTSIWVRFANQRRMLGQPTDDLTTRLLLILGDHPFLCALVVSACFYLAALAVRKIWKHVS